MIELAAPTVVAPRATVLAAVCDVELAATVPAPQQTCQQRLTAPDRPSAHEALAIGVVADQALVPVELSPVNIALVVAIDQNLPAAAILAKAAHDPFAAVRDGDAAFSAPEYVGASIDRVCQDVMQRIVERQLPHHLAAFGTVFDGRQWQALLAHPQMDLPDGLQLSKFGEDQCDRLLHAAVGIFLDAVTRTLHIADRYGEEELAATR